MTLDNIKRDHGCKMWSKHNKGNIFGDVA